MHIVLVNMPWALIDVPSLAVGILRRSVLDSTPTAEVSVVHANLDYVDWLSERREFGLDDYYFMALDTYFAGLGDWVFSSALYDDPNWRTEHIGASLDYGDARNELALDLHRSAVDFVADLARRVVELRPDVVGFTSTFQQNTASLAAARMVKTLAPQTITMMGGANCDGAQGAAIARNFAMVDYVVRGEGERVMPQLVSLLAGTQPPDPTALASIPGLCWRDEAGEVMANPMSTTPLPPASIVSPNYDGYFERLDESIARDWVEPKLVVEGSRGCWWGDKHQCTFCGLNGSFMQFRSKSPAAFYDEILEQVARHQVLDLYVVDNILDMGYLRSLLPRLAESGYDLRVQYEIKSNLKRDQLRGLVEAGLVNVQPGIESLSSRVLSIMDKGVTGCQNVRMLRDASTVGLSVSWNYLFGFPGELVDDYVPIIEQFPALHHLPPLEGVARIAIERFSPYFDRPELGFGDITPDPQYRRTYDLPDTELTDLAYLFAAPPLGIDDILGDRLRAAAARWQREHTESSLSMVEYTTHIVLVSHRKDFDWHLHTLREPLELSVFRLLDQPHTISSLSRKLDVAAAGIAAVLTSWQRLGIVFRDDDHYVHVVPAAVNQELIKLPRQYDEAGTAPQGAQDQVDPEQLDPARLDPERLDLEHFDQQPMPHKETVGAQS